MHNACLLARLNHHWDGGGSYCCIGSDMSFREIGDTTDHDRAVGSGGVCVEIGTIGRVSGLGLEILFGFDGHCERGNGSSMVLSVVVVKLRIVLSY